jgi:hypothetical protein
MKNRVDRNILEPICIYQNLPYTYARHECSPYCALKKLEGQGKHHCGKAHRPTFINHTVNTL